MSSERRPSTVSLEAPERTGVEDPGAHELESSESDDHFSDAQSGSDNSQRATSPIPRTRVERVDDEPAYGEVPGTHAYDKRTSDAAPDEIAFQEGHRIGSASTPSASPTPSIPKTVVDETDDVPGSSTHNFHVHLHEADATPDMIRKPDGTAEANAIPSPPKSTAQDTDDAVVDQVSQSPLKDSPRQLSQAIPPIRIDDEEMIGHDDEDGDDADFGDDFNEFEEGDEDADFGDFDDGFQQPEAPATIHSLANQSQVSVPSFPILDLDGLDAEEILSASEPYLDALYPPDVLEILPLPAPPHDNPIFFNPRSASLWSQLAAPPPLQPPDWIRSRIRRLFLVSLGVPVDLDEILPASKQKKLVLPSLNRVTSNGSLRTSTDSRSLSRLRKQDANSSSVSIDSQGKEKPSSSSKKRKGLSQVPEFDLVAAKQLCATTDEALKGMTDAELQQHVNKLKEMEDVANEVHEFWKKRTDEKIGDREAFEGVIENLVKHARKTRK
ncbi:hypothetical protein F5Y18DRAFT_403432 [Xylariaceae sp. FL1019]|nr:hypothetical protein F5Y18DRAFT_403432 [Xylariaceae sp. FL1019]